MPTLLGVQVAQAARDAGLPASKLITAVAIAKAESGWRSDARLVTSREDSRGLWQINTFAHPSYDPERLYEPLYNAQAMVSISKGGEDFKPWSVFTNLKYKAHIAEATTAVAGIGGTGTVGESAPGVPQVLTPSPPQFTPAPTASLVAGMSLVDPGQLVIEGELIGARATVLSAELVRSITDASSLVVRVLDPTRELLRSDITRQRSRTQVDGIHFELADISKYGNELTLTFLDHAAAVYINDTGKIMAQAPGAATRGEFLRRLAAEHPEVPVDIETGATTLEELRTEPDESLWQAMGRIARQIGWRRLATANRLLIGSDEWLMGRTPPLTVREFAGGVESIDFDYALGSTVDEAMFTCSTRLWAGPPTQAVDVEGCGWADGTWLVSQVARSLSSTEARISLTRPARVLPEPAPAPEGTVLDGLDLGAAIPGLGPQVDLDNTGWAGTQAICEALTTDFEALGLTLTSAKRDRQTTSSGGTSDHWVGSLTAYAEDWSNGGSPTPQMDLAAERVMARLGLAHSGQATLNYRGHHTFNGLRVRVQCLYRTNVGGNHYNHLHVGVKRA